MSRRRTVNEAAATTEQPERDENPIGLPPMPAHLEGQGDAKTPVDLALMPAYEQGRAAFRGSIGEDDAPYGDGTARDAWVKGWNFEKKARG